MRDNYLTNLHRKPPKKKLKEGVKYNIEAVRPNGEPLAPKKIADKFVRQCGVLVKDQLPISLQEWREPAKDKRQKGKEDAAPRPDVTFVDKNQKDLLWDTLMEHFTLPDHFTEADVQKVKDAALRKMAVAFKNHKNREWDKYVKGGRKTPVFEGTLENQRAHWDDFVKFKDSELAKERSRINKKNAEKRISSISWGQVATRWQCLSGISLRKRWRMQVSLRLLRAGPPGSGLGSMRMGGVGPEDMLSFKEGMSERSRRYDTCCNRRGSIGGVQAQQRERRAYTCLGKS